MSSPTPESTSASSSRVSSSASLRKLTTEDTYSDSSAPSSGSSSPRARSRSPKPGLPMEGYLAPPTVAEAWRNFSRSPSPMGLIPIHRTFSSLIHKHEVPRKVLHVSIGFVVLYLYRNGYQPSSITPPLMTLLVPVASADILRFYSPSFNRFYIRVLGALMRESEVRGWNGVVWYLVGSIVVLSLFPKDISSLSIILLSWCDTAASTVGRMWGRYTPQVRRGKSLAGCLASFVVGAVAAAVFWGLVVPNTPDWANDAAYPLMWNERLGIEGVGEVTGGWALAMMSVVTGVIASVSEALDCFGLDDNVVIPVVSAVGVWGVLKAFG